MSACYKLCATLTSSISCSPSDPWQWPLPIQAACDYIVHNVEQHLVQHLPG